MFSIGSSTRFFAGVFVKPKGNGCGAFDDHEPMSELKDLEWLFNGRHFDREVIVLCVRWYLRYKLSLRDLVEMMAERGLSLLTLRSCVG
jgi:hypothetical protein